MPLSLLSALSLVPAPDRPDIGPSLVTSEGRALPLLAAKLRGEARGGIARLVLEQTFENRHDEPLHVTYRMPLPADGAVSGFAFEIAGRTISGVVEPKAKAREQFEQAIVDGKTAALLEQQRADIFTQQIGNLPPHERLIARITVDQKLAWLPEGEWELRFPTVIGPRFLDADATAADARDTAIDVAPEGIAARISIEIAIADAVVAGRRPSSPSHAIAKQADGVVVLGAPAALDRDIVVRWPVAGRDVGISLDTGTHRERSYGLVTIVPPARPVRGDAPYRTAPTAVPRDLIVLLDTSGSMSGEPLAQAKHVVGLLIESLDERDRLELIEFSSSPRRYRRDPIAATPDAKRAALAWLRALSAGGSTEMGAAVREALHAIREGAQRQVVLVTDGYVGGEQQIVKQLHDSLPASCRLHVVGIGSAVNRSIAIALARAGRGAEVLVGLDEDIERGAKRLLDRTRLPVLTNVELSGSALVRCAPEHVPDVFEGAPIVVAVELAPGGGELIVRGELAGSERWEQRLRVTPNARYQPAIAALYGRERVADLEMRATFAASDAIDREIEALGIAHQIATRMTSWLAIDHLRTVDGTARHASIPQALPYGTTAASFGLRGAVEKTSLRLGGTPMKTMAFAADMPAMLSAPHAAARLEQGSPAKVPFTKRGPRLAPWLLVLIGVLALAALLWWLVL